MIRTLLATAALAAIASQAQAGIVINYAGGFSGACGSGLSCVGNTAVNGSVLRLTPASTGQAGAGYSTTAITLGAGATFSTSFQFQLTQPGGIAPADGITFVLAQGTSGLGGAGGGMGYQGVVNSVAIEFDTYWNDFDPNSNHVGVDSNGSLSSAIWTSPYGVSSCDFGSNSYLADGCMSNGKVWSAFINYDGTTQKLNVSVQQQGLALVQLITNYSIDIASILGTNDAYVGFTAATGAGLENHDILSWQLANDTSIVGPGGDLPEPADLALLGLAGAAALWAGRRRRG
ncbi:MAG: PEP-CTERM sorting domain-containing protein [Comamonadaceae bacterium]|nr:PEP-CTERM sorting domain-containing protein [Comamonadaceae bacterium]